LKRKEELPHRFSKKVWVQPTELKLPLTHTKEEFLQKEFGDQWVTSEAQAETKEPAEVLEEKPADSTVMPEQTVPQTAPPETEPEPSGEDSEKMAEPPFVEKEDEFASWMEVPEAVKHDSTQEERPSDSVAAVSEEPMVPPVSWEGIEKPPNEQMIISLKR
jgi:hypothetical protein